MVELDKLQKRMQSFYDKKSKKWKDSEEWKLFLETVTWIESAQIAPLNDALTNLKELQKLEESRESNI